MSKIVTTPAEPPLQTAPAVPIAVPATKGDERIYFIQETWPLSSEELGQIIRNRSAATEFGVVLVVFATGHLLPFVIKLVEDYANKAAWLTDSSKAGVGILVVGFAFWIYGYCLGSERRDVLKKIEVHFKSNPGQRRRI